MYKALDNIYFRFKEALAAFKEPYYGLRNYGEGLDTGVGIGKSTIIQHLQKHDPYQFENNHFKMGYYYALEQARSCKKDDEDNTVA